MEKYVAALHVYVDIAGQNNTSYASALANIGKLPIYCIYHAMLLLLSVLIWCWFPTFSIL